MKPTHLDAAGRVSMVDVLAKPLTARTPVVSGRIRMNAETLSLVLAGDLPKGDVAAMARISGIQAAKQTSGLLPLCHPLSLTHIAVDVVPETEVPAMRVTTVVRTSDRTGVEMAALVAAPVALLAIYDMVKAVDRGMVIEQVELIEKRGGESGDFNRGAVV